MAAHDPPDVACPDPWPGDTPHPPNPLEPPGSDQPDEPDEPDEPDGYDEESSEDDVPLFVAVDGEVFVEAYASPATASVPATLAATSPPVTTAALPSPCSRVGMIPPRIATWNHDDSAAWHAGSTSLCVG
jgi:hypothetical protein